MSVEQGLPSWLQWILAAAGAIGAKEAIKSWIDHKRGRSTAMDDREERDRDYLRQMVDQFTIDLRHAVAAARDEAKEARAEAAAMRERVRMLEDRVRELEHENEVLRGAHA